MRGLRVPRSNILLEPQGKNTAPAIGWAAASIHRKNSNAVMAVFPSDHLILNQKVFVRCLQEAVRLAERGHLVTFGIVPTRLETGYGYFKTAAVAEAGKSFLRVIKFIEKPSRERAEKLLQEGNYFWNSGMFVWKTSVILNEFKRYQPVIYQLLYGKGAAAIVRIWSKLPAISIDYGILEKSHKVAAVAARNLQWSDVGSWQSLSEVLPKDARGNFFKGDVLNVGSQNTFVWGGTRLISTIGLKDLVIVDTCDALLICRVDQSQKVKDVVEGLKKQSSKIL